MTYVPVHPVTITPGMHGDGVAWRRLVDNHDHLAHDWTPHIASGCSGAELGGASRPLVYLETPDLTESYQAVLRAQHLGNTDNAPLQVVSAVETGGVSVQFAILCAGIEVATQTISGSGTLDQTFVPGGTIGALPFRSREITIQVRATGPGATWVALGSTAVRYAVTAAPSGVQPSGWARMQAVPAALAGQPITSERVERMVQGPYWLARDRPVCVLSMLSDATQGNEGEWSTGSTSGITVAKYLIDQHGPPSRYGYAAYVTDAAARVDVIHGGKQWTESEDGPVGWRFRDLGTLAGELGAVRLRAATGRVGITTFQLYRIGRWSNQP